MMVLSRNAAFAIAAMLTPCWLEKKTRLAGMSRVKDHFVIRVARHFLCMVVWCNE